MNKNFVYWDVRLLSRICLMKTTAFIVVVVRVVAVVTVALDSAVSFPYVPVAVSDVNGAMAVCSSYCC